MKRLHCTACLRECTDEMGQPADGIATEEWGAGGALSRPRLCRSIQCNTRQDVRLDNSCNSPRAPDRGTVYTVPWRRIVIVGYSWYTLPAAFPLNLAPAFVLAISYQAAIMSASTASLDIAVAPGLASPVPQLPNARKPLLQHLLRRRLLRPVYRCSLAPLPAASRPP